MGNSALIFTLQQYTRRLSRLRLRCLAPTGSSWDIKFITVSLYFDIFFKQYVYITISNTPTFAREVHNHFARCPKQPGNLTTHGIF